MASNKDGKVRCRVRNSTNESLNSTGVEELTKKTSNARVADTEYNDRNNKLESGTYWLTRIVFLRSLAFVYCKLLHRMYF